MSRENQPDQFGEHPGPGPPTANMPAAAMGLFPENSEPTAGSAELPVLLIGLLVVLLYWGDVYLLQNSGEFNPKVYYPYRSYEQVVLLNPIDPVAAREREGRKVFDLVCAACHMPSGTGNRGNNVPPLAGSEWVLAEGPNRIIRIVLNGLQGSLEVKGDQYGANVMTPFNILTDDQIAAALTFVSHKRQGWQLESRRTEENSGERLNRRRACLPHEQDFFRTSQSAEPQLKLDRDARKQNRYEAKTPPAAPHHHRRESGGGSRPRRMRLDGR